MNEKGFVIAWLNYELGRLKLKFLRGFVPLSDKDQEYQVALKNLLSILEKED